MIIDTPDKEETALGPTVDAAVERFDYSPEVDAPLSQDNRLPGTPHDFDYTDIFADLTERGASRDEMRTAALQNAGHATRNLESAIARKDYAEMKYWHTNLQQIHTLHRDVFDEIRIRARRSDGTARPDDLASVGRVMPEGLPALFASGGMNIEQINDLYSTRTATGILASNPGMDQGTAELISRYRNGGVGPDEPQFRVAAQLSKAEQAANGDREAFFDAEQTIERGQVLAGEMDSRFNSSEVDGNTPGPRIPQNIIQDAGQKASEVSRNLGLSSESVLNVMSGFKRAASHFTDNRGEQMSFAVQELSTIADLAAKDPNYARVARFVLEEAAARPAIMANARNQGALAADIAALTKRAGSGINHILSRPDVPEESKPALIKTLLDEASAVAGLAVGPVEMPASAVVSPAMRALGSANPEVRQQGMQALARSEEGQQQLRKLFTGVEIKPEDMETIIDGIANPPVAGGPVTVDLSGMNLTPEARRLLGVPGDDLTAVDMSSVLRRNVFTSREGALDALSTLQQAGDQVTSRTRVAQIQLLNGAIEALEAAISNPDISEVQIKELNQQLAARRADLQTAQAALASAEQDLFAVTSPEAQAPEILSRMGALLGTPEADTILDDFKHAGMPLEEYRRMPGRRSGRATASAQADDSDRRPGENHPRAGMADGFREALSRHTRANPPRKTAGVGVSEQASAFFRGTLRTELGNMPPVKLGLATDSDLTTIRAAVGPAVFEEVVDKAATELQAEFDAWYAATNPITSGARAGERERRRIQTKLEGMSARFADIVTDFLADVGAISLQPRAKAKSGEGVGVFQYTLNKGRAPEATPRNRLAFGTQALTPAEYAEAIMADIPGGMAAVRQAGESREQRMAQIKELKRLHEVHGPKIEKAFAQLRDSAVSTEQVELERARHLNMTPEQHALAKEQRAAVAEERKYNRRRRDQWEDFVRRNDLIERNRAARGEKGMKFSDMLSAVNRITDEAMLDMSMEQLDMIREIRSFALTGIHSEIGL